MYRLLKKYRLITVLPFEDTFFYTLKLPKKVRLTKELIELNYAKFSPFSHPNSLAVYSNDQIYIWFYAEQVQTPIVIPESYIFFKELLKRNENAVYVLSGKVQKVLVIKENLFHNCFTQKSLDDTMLKLICDESQVYNIVHIDAEKTQALKQRSLENLLFRDIYTFNNLVLDRKVILQKAVEKLSYPVAALLLLSLFASYFNEKWLTQKIENLKSQYLLEKSKSEETSQYIAAHNEEVKQWSEFVDKELVFLPPNIVLDKVYGTIQEGEDAHLSYFSLAGNLLVIKMYTSLNPVVILNRLNAIDYFSRVAIKDSRNTKTKTKIITYDIELKKVKELVHE